MQGKILEDEFALSTTTLLELENIKESRNKDDETKYRARNILRILDGHKYKSVVYNNDVLDIIREYKLTDSNDNQICACAKMLSKTEDVTFVTGDLSCKTIAKNVFNLKCESIRQTEEVEYKGFIEKSLSEKDMAYFYENITENIYSLFTNQYLVIKDLEENVVDKFKWNGEEYQPIKYPAIKSNYFGSVKPLNGDIYQQMVLNSLSTNQITMIKGSAGTGKSYLAIGYFMYLLEKKKIDKIVVFCNTVATVNSAKLGYYPGSKDEKLLDSSIGNMLSAKLGDAFGLFDMVKQGKIQLLPLSDIRGFDTNGMNCGVYITEAQNMDISLMKLALQRIGEDSVCVIDGDYHAQVDMSQYAGANNGMRRMSEVFRGQDFYGEVELQNIFRSRIAAIAELM